MKSYKRPLFLLLLISLLFAFSCGTNTNLTNPDQQEALLFGTDDSFEVLTWNLRTFPLNNPGTLEIIAQMIPLMKVDVIAFQEIMDYAAFIELASMIPHYNAFVYTATTSYRLAYLYDTRTVTVREQYTIYNGDTNPFPRAPYVMEITWKGIDMVLINNHLKAMGDNVIDENDLWDEEVRRRLACEKLDIYIRGNFDSDRVILLGDLNDQIQEPEEYNVFMSFLSRPDEYLFTTMHIAQNPTTATVSYPMSFSHIDHLLITNELFDAF
ncbi:MAG: endonuclease/exonuclease/phosphatase family protein, partial [Candidatus Cloacimonadaceae bacterium]|nr:endonuclease/exonuclease/phosphatase family protein [Candidatus Cloacimonadaceae bacterium]